MLVCSKKINKYECQYYINYLVRIMKISKTYDIAN